MEEETSTYYMGSDKKQPKDYNIKRIIIITYLIYIIFWETLCLVGGASMIIYFNKSGWWMLLAVLLACSPFKPHSWHSLWDGVNRMGKDDD